MFRHHEEIRKWLYEIVEKFRQKGATSPDKALMAQELGLPPRFQEAMERRLGRSGIFVEVNGKYYLSEERLKQVEEMRETDNVTEKSRGPRKNMMPFRIAKMATLVILIVLLLVNIFVQSWELRLISVLLIVLWIALTVIQIVYLSRARKRMFSPQRATAK